MPRMRAKVRLNRIEKYDSSEKLVFNPVAKSGSYPADGSDEDNTFAKYSPSGEFSLMVANPALLNQFEVGESYYVDFTPVPAAVPAEAKEGEAA